MKRYTASKIVLTVGGTLLSVAVLATTICYDNTNQINSYLGTSNTESVGEGVEYYPSEYSEDQEGFDQLISDTDEVIQEEIEEGALLLKNDTDADGNPALPLASGSKVTTYGRGSIDPVYSSSGSVGSSSTGREVDFIQGLEDAGLEVNDVAVNAYNNLISTYDEDRNGMGTDGPMIEEVNEVPWSVINSEVTNLSEYGDAAFFVVTRYAGEGNKELNHNGTVDTYNGDSLTLSDDERDVLRGLKEKKDAGEVKKIIVILNCTAIVDLDWLDDEEYGVDACISVQGTGTTGFEGLGRLIVGDVNPSGKSNDTLWYQNSANPTLANQSSYDWENIDEFDDLQSATDGAGIYESHYMIYQEGLYLGYRYTESRYADYVMDVNNAGDFNYDEVVAIPFGYGLSYTTFEQSIDSVTYDEDTDTYSVQVTVKNTGDVAGKDAVEVYIAKPYDATDENYNSTYGVASSVVQLAGYGKTDLISPDGGTDTVTVTIDRKDFASYDADNKETYVLTPGDYYLVIGNGAHDATNNLLAAEGYTPDSTSGRMDAEGDASLAYRALALDTVDDETYSTSVTGAEISNLFEDSDPNKSDLTDKDTDVEWIDRSDWNGTVKFETYDYDCEYEYVNDVHEKLNLNNTLLASMRAGWDGSLLTEDDIEYPTYGEDNGLQLSDLISTEDDEISYDDERWDDLLDELTWDDTVNLLSNGMRQTAAITSINKPQTIDHNGCLGVTQSFTASSSSLASEVGITTNTQPSRFASGGILASSMNHDLAYRVGQLYGENALWAGYSGLYGPGVNIHRSQYSGRNSEYYSEDAYLSGYPAADLINGMQEKGIYAYIKHFVLNDQEVNRYGLSVWLNEQSFREIYLKAFQIVIEKANPHAMMTSYSRVGSRVAACKSNLLNDWLRGEEGFDGFTVTDMYIESSMAGLTFYIGQVQIPTAVSCGNDLVDGSIGGQFDQYSSGYGELAWDMRESAHRILYVVANSAAMNGVAELEDVWTWWQMTLVALDVVFGVVAAVGLVFFCYEYYAKNIAGKKKN